ncbi:MAG: ATP-dependent zinc metalloprotease FtsH [Rikenellaceae bacterium]
MKKRKFNIYWIYLLIPLLLLVWNIFGENTITKEVSWQSVKSEMLEIGAVKEIVVVNDKIAQVYLKPDQIDDFKSVDKYKNIPSTGAQFEFRIGSLEKFENDFEDAQQGVSEKAEIRFEEQHSMWDSFFSSIFPIFLMIGALLLVMRMMNRGSGGSGGSNVFSVGKAKAQVFDKNNKVKINFKDVAGLAEAKVEVMEIVDFLKNPSKYSELGGKIPKGALLVGPPGTGKTLLAKAVAGEADVPFFSISGSDFVEMFVGVGASRVRDLFAQAKSKAPCIVFIDEIDAIGRARSKNGGFSSNDERENTLNQLLTEMDGFGTNAGVIILAATNRADILDKALLRAGRFDRQIHVELPDITERAQIFNVHLAKIKLADDFNSEFLSKQTPGFSGADIANVCNEAALIAARHDKKAVEKQDFLDAVDRIIGGLERKSKLFTRREKHTIAYHEAGHATVSWMLEHANPLIKVTIIPRGKALGAAWYMPQERQITTREQLLHELSSLLGGRVAEELTFGEISTGALNDLERSTKMAYAMIAYYGMSDKIGNMSYYDSSGNDTFTKPYSEDTAKEIDKEVKKLVEEAYAAAKKILMEYKDGFTKLAELLLAREVVFSDDLEEIFGKRVRNEEYDREMVINEALMAEAAIADDDNSDDNSNDTPSLEIKETGSDNNDNSNQSKSE